MMRLSSILAVAVVWAICSAQSNAESPVTRTAGPGYIPVTQPRSVGGLCNQAVCVNPRYGVPLDFFARAHEVDNLFARVAEISAIAAAMQDAVPNPGDRFAIRLNVATTEEDFAGAIGLGVNLTDRARFSFNYGRGETQNVFSGGLNLSFR